MDAPTRDEQGSEKGTPAIGAHDERQPRRVREGERTSRVKVLREVERCTYVVIILGCAFAAQAARADGKSAQQTVHSTRRRNGEH